MPYSNEVIARIARMQGFEMTESKFQEFFRKFTKRSFLGLRRFWEQNDIGILSMTTDPLNLPMWGYYASDNKGVIFEIDISHKCFGKNGVDKFKQVKYSKIRPIVKYPPSQDEITSWLFTKSKVWEHEKEYRSVTRIASLLRFSNGLIGTFPLSPDAVKSVYVGIRARGEFLEKVKMFCKEYGIPCGRVRYDMREYKLLPPHFEEPLGEPLY